MNSKGKIVRSRTIATGWKAVSFRDTDDAGGFKKLWFGQVLGVSTAAIFVLFSDKERPV